MTCLAINADIKSKSFHFILMHKCLLVVSQRYALQTRQARIITSISRKTNSGEQDAQFPSHPLNMYPCQCQHVSWLRCWAGKKEGGRGQNREGRRRKGRRENTVVGNELWRAWGWVQCRVKLQMASSRQDKPVHMLGLGLDFTPLLMRTGIHKCKNKGWSARELGWGSKTTKGRTCQD